MTDTCDLCDREFEEGGVIGYRRSVHPAFYCSLECAELYREKYDPLNAMRAALEPFAALPIPELAEDDQTLYSFGGVCITAGQIRDARLAVKR